MRGNAGRVMPPPRSAPSWLLGKMPLEAGNEAWDSGMFRGLRIINTGIINVSKCLCVCKSLPSGEISLLGPFFAFATKKQHWSLHHAFSCAFALCYRTLPLNSVGALRSPFVPNIPRSTNRRLAPNESSVIHQPHKKNTRQKHLWMLCSSDFFKMIGLLLPHRSTLVWQ